MIVRCIRCDTEFSSSRSHTHVCPSCNLVFKEGDSEQEGLEIVHTSDLIRQNTGHHLLEEAEDKCAFHPDADAIEYCRHCGRPVCYACAVNTEQGCSCEPCAEDPKAVPAAKPPGRLLGKAREDRSREEEEAKAITISQAFAGQPYVAWEHRRHIGWLNALLATWRQTLFSPSRFFHALPLVGGYRSPLLYGMFWVLAGVTASLAWKILFQIYPVAITFFEGTEIRFSLQFSRSYVLGTVALFLSPLVAVMMVLVACTIYHLFVMLFTRQHAGFEATLRVVCYSTGTHVFFFIPLLGELLGGLWQLILVTMGFKEVHRISLPLAVIVTIVPYTLFLAFWIALMFWAVAGSGLGLEDRFIHLVSSLFS